MQISLTTDADRRIQRLMSLGYSSPSSIIEVALERMEQTELSEDSPKILAWLRQEVAIGAEEAEHSEFSTSTLAEMKAQVFRQIE
jgi:Arc/MetJ-type ribon-helix-helix transcriptional regulator